MKKSRNAPKRKLLLKKTTFLDLAVRSDLHAGTVQGQLCNTQPPYSWVGCRTEKATCACPNVPGWVLSAACY